MPLTNKEKQQALRKRRADEGLKEIRCVWAKESDHKILKSKIRKMIDKMRKSGA